MSPGLSAFQKALVILTGLRNPSFLRGGFGRARSGCAQPTSPRPIVGCYMQLSGATKSGIQ